MKTFRVPNLVLTCIALTAIVSMNTRTALAQSGTITSGPYTAGINTNGTIVGQTVDNAYVGLKRTFDGVDAIIPGIARDSWGISEGTNVGYVDPYYTPLGGVSNVSTFFGVSTATTVSSFFNLTIQNSFSFAAVNVLKDTVTITNNSSSAQTVGYSHNTDVDILPTGMLEITTLDPLGGGVFASTYNGFDIPYPGLYGSPGAAGGGAYGPGDYGFGFNLTPVVLGSGGSWTFNVFSALNMPGQTEAALRSQLTSLGATWIATSTSSDPSFTNSTALAYSPVSTTVPEPTSIVLLSIGGLGLALRPRKLRSFSTLGWCLTKGTFVTPLDVIQSFRRPTGR